MLRVSGLGLSVLLFVSGVSLAGEPTESDEGAGPQSEAVEAIAYYGPDSRFADRWSGGWWPPQYGQADPAWRRAPAPIRPYWYDRSWRQQGQWRGWQSGRQFRRQPYDYYGNPNRAYGGGYGWQPRQPRRWRNPPGFASPYAYRDWQDARPWQRYGYAGAESWR